MGERFVYLELDGEDEVVGEDGSEDGGERDPQADGLPVRNWTVMVR